MIKKTLLALFIWLFGCDIIAPVIVNGATLTIIDKKLYKQILKNKPNMDQAYATRLAEAILKASKRHKVDPYRLAAILRQESNYDMSAHNKKSGDWGLAQVNYKTIKLYKINKARLMLDMEYAVDKAALILADFKDIYGAKDKDFWTRYNSSKKDKRKAYKVAVMRYM